MAYHTHASHTVWIIITLYINIELSVSCLLSKLEPWLCRQTRLNEKQYVVWRQRNCLNHRAWWSWPADFLVFYNHMVLFNTFAVLILVNHRHVVVSDHYTGDPARSYAFCITYIANKLIIIPSKARQIPFSEWHREWLCSSIRRSTKGVVLKPKFNICIWISEIYFHLIILLFVLDSFIYVIYCRIFGYAGFYVWSAFIHRLRHIAWLCSCISLWLRGNCVWN